MKTLTEVTKEIAELTRSINKDSSEKEVKAVKSRVAFLRMCQRYLETNPREEFIQKQLNETRRRIDLLPTHFAGWQTGKVLTKYKDPYAAYCTEMGLSDMKNTVKTLEYLLS